MPTETMNGLICSLPGELRTQLKPQMARVRFRRDAILLQPDQPLDYVYFIESGLASLVWPMPPKGVDIAVIGHEGLLGHEAVLGGRETLAGAVARTDLVALRIAIGDVQALMKTSPAFSALALAFVQTLVLQIAESAFLNARATVEQRLARWIALASDRLSSGTINFTHDCLAAAVGCRRAGVTVALHMLEGERIIKARRSRVMVIDGERLRQAGAAAIEQTHEGGARTRTPATQFQRGVS